MKAQLEIIEEAMKNAGVWSTEIPGWIKNYQENHMMDIWQWLQYIYLPMRHKGILSEPHYIAPVLSPFLTTEPKYREILQLMIALDGISSTIDKN